MSISQMAKKEQARPRKLPSQERSREMFEAILEAAAKVFVQLGYARATTNKIAEAAGISVGSLYQYFPSKDAIAVELLRRYRLKVLGVVGSALGRVNERGLEKVVYELVDALLRAEGIDPTLQRVLIEAVLRTGARAEVLGFEERLEEVVADQLRAANTGVAERDLRVASFLVVRVVLAVVHAVRVDRTELDTARLRDHVTRLIVRYLSP
jgi:AcrR family transcriptional regulator